MAGANHAAHYGIQQSQDKWLINRYRNGEKFDLSRISKMKINLERGARLAYLHSRGLTDIKGPMRMGDVFDYESMSKTYSGWKKTRYTGTEFYTNKSIPGLDKVTFYEAVADIKDIDMSDGWLEFVTQPDRKIWAGKIWYNMSTATNEGIYLLARSYIMYYGYHK